MEKFGCARAAALNITNGGDEKENWRALSATQKTHNIQIFLQQHLDALSLLPF